MGPQAKEKAREWIFPQSQSQARATGLTGDISPAVGFGWPHGQSLLSVCRQVP